MSILAIREIEQIERSIYKINKNFDAIGDHKSAINKMLGLPENEDKYSEESNSEFFYRIYSKCRTDFYKKKLLYKAKRRELKLKRYMLLCYHASHSELEEINIKYKFYSHGMLYRIFASLDRQKYMIEGPSYLDILWISATISSQETKDLDFYKRHMTNRDLSEFDMI